MKKIVLSFILVLMFSTMSQALITVGNDVKLGNFYDINLTTSANFTATTITSNRYIPYIELYAPYDCLVGINSTTNVLQKTFGLLAYETIWVPIKAFSVTLYVKPSTPCSANARVLK